MFILPYDYFISLNEVVTSGNQVFSVTPLQYEEYQRLMMKPYAFPLKRTVWRLITNNRACNYVKSYIDDGNGNLTKCYYSVISSWADQQRNLRITVKMQDSWNPLDEHDDYITIEDSTIYFPVDTVEGVNYAKVSADCGWLGSKLTYKVRLWVYIDNVSLAEDAVAFKIIKEGFQKLEDKLGNKLYTRNTEITNAATHLDLFQQSEAPNGFKNTMASDGLELTTQVVPVP